MALQARHDKYETKGLTLSSFVALCMNCDTMCSERTKRVVENRSRAPKGWEREYVAVAEQRRKEDYDLCLSHCQRVLSACPDPVALERFESLRFKKVLPTSGTVDIPPLQQISRCEHTVSDLSRVLFSLAHKPSKVVFENIDPKTGENLSKGGDGEPTEVHKKVLSGSSIDDEILSRWSTAKRGRMGMENIGVMRSVEETPMFKEDMERRKAEESIKMRGTTPSW